MPIDFRTYTDPGVYIEAITPPVVFTAAIEPTIIGIVGEAPSARDAFESTNLVTGSATSLTTLGGDPATVKVKDRLLGTQYVSAAIAVMSSAVDDNDLTFTATTFDGVVPAATLDAMTPFSILIEDEELSVTDITAGTWTVTRAQNSTTGVQHLAGQVINLAETYADGDSIGIGDLAAPIASTQTSITVTEDPNTTRFTLVAFTGTDSFKFTFNSVETAAVTRGTNYTRAGIKTVLEAHANITTVNVYDLYGRDQTPGDEGFIVEIVTADMVDDLTLTTLSGVTYTAAQGAATDSYIEVEGERMLVTGVSGSAPQTVTVERGVSGTYAGPHGAVAVTQNTGADFTVRTGTGDDALMGTSDDTLAISILDSSRISNGSAINVAFSATDTAQFSTGLFNDIDTIRDKYGDPLDADGQINSALTLGAQLAFANGATQVVLVAANPEDTNPIQDAIAKLAFEQSVNSIVVLSGESLDLTYAKGHVEQMSDNGLLRRAFLGLDGLTSPSPTSSDFITKAGQLHSERVSLVGPSRFKLDNGTGTPLLVPGYYAAAAVAGIQAGQTPQEPLTRKQVFGFIGIDDQDSSQNIFLMQSGGVLVVFEDRFGRLIIKHGLTTDMTSVYSREISVVTARDRLRDFILETLEGGDLIGSAMSSETPNLVMAAVNSALEESVRQGLIFDYGDVKYRYPTENPTMIQVRFSYKPSLPLNYIHVQFSIDTNTGTVDFQNINDNTSTQ